MPTITSQQVRDEGNLTDTITTAQLSPHIATAKRQLQDYLGRDTYEAIEQKDDSSYTPYNSNFSAGVDGWAQNAGDANLLVTGNNDSILGRDNVLAVQASGSAIDLRIVRAAETPEGGKAYRMRFDYFAEEDSGINYLGMEIGATKRNFDPVGEFTGIPVIEESWQVAKAISFMGMGELNLTGYSSPGGGFEDDSIAQLASGKFIYFQNMHLEFLNDLAILTIAEAKWGLGIALPALGIHSAGDGLTMRGGAGDNSYDLLSQKDAAAMGKSYISEAKKLLNSWFPKDDSVLAGGGILMTAI